MFNITAIYANIAWGLLGVVSCILIVLALLAWRNPVLYKIGLRNIPRRATQSVLIVVGLTLSTIIIVASFATGDTLNVSVRRQAVAAYGNIDEIIAPPLISLFTSLGASGQETEESAAAQEELSQLFEGGLTSVLTILDGGLPGISTDRLAQLKLEAAEEPLIDGVAGSILFPTIIRNTSTGQGEPLGFIFAVDDDYDQTFGLNTIAGQPVEIESLTPGVGNIFLRANELFSMVGDLGQRAGIDLSISNVATVVAAAGALLAGAQEGDLANMQISLETLEEMGIDTQPLEDAGISEINLGELIESVPGLEQLLSPTVEGGSVISTSVVGTPVGGTSVISTPVVGTPVVGTSVVGTPVVSTSVVGTSVITATNAGTLTITTTDAPTTDAPTTDTLTTDTPTTDTPTTDAPTTDAPTTDAPPTGVPATDTPPTDTPPTDAPPTGVLAGLAAQAGNVLGSINLATMGSELDRVLGEYGLQLRQGDLYLNRIGAERLNAQPGDVLELFIGPIPVPFRVKAIVEEASPVGALLPVAVMRLDEAQKLLFMGGKVNNVLVSNQGDMLGGVEHTDAVSQRLSVLAMDPEGLEKAVEILRRPDVLARVRTESEKGLEGFIGEDDVPPIIAGIITSFAPGINTAIDSMAALPAALDDPASDTGGISSELRTLLADNNVRSWLLGLRLPGDANSELASAFGTLNSFDVLTPLSKQTVLMASDIGGSLFTSLFSVFGFFSVIAGILLIFLIFVMLAAERRSEMGIARAIGVQRGHLVEMFVSEGMVYSVAAATLGVLLGLGISFVMIEYLGSIINNVAGQVSGGTAGILSIAFQVSPLSIAISWSLGLLLTFIVVFWSSWRVSRLNIVAAIRNLPDETNARRMSWWGRISRWILPIVLLLLAWRFVTWGLDLTLWTSVLIGATFALFGGFFLLGRILEYTNMRRATIDRIVYTFIGLGLLGLWITPWQRVLPQMGLDDFAGDPTQILAVFAIGGPMIITGAIMAIMFNADFFTWITDKLFGGIGALTPILKTAIAWPLSTRFRTGMAMVLFAMIMATVIIMSMVISATQSLIVLTPRQSGGFEIQTSETLLSFFDPITDLTAKVEEAKADFPLLNEIAHVGSVGSRQILATPELEGSSAGYVDLAGMSDGFIEQAATIYPLALRAAGYETDAAVWEALRTRDDAVIVRDWVTAPAEGEAPGPPPIDEEFAFLEDGPPRRDVYTRLHVAGADPESDQLPELWLELSNETEFGTRTRRVQVIGVLDDGEQLVNSAMQGNQTLLNDLAGEVVKPSRNYVKVNEGADVEAVAQELERAFLGNGLDASIMAASIAQGREFTRNILGLLQGFMALGLLVGIAGLGVISTRTVVERRQQVGMLRSIGYQARMVALSFLLESSFIAVTGILIGALTGIVLGLNIVNLTFSNIAEFHMPWGSIIGIVVLAWAASLLTTALPAWQASRIYPAEALRYE